MAIAREIEPGATTTALADPDARSVPSDAWTMFGSQASGLAATFTPAILGLAAPLGTISGILEGHGPPPAILGAVATYGALWLLLWGGVIDTFARGWQGWRQFASASGRAVAPLFAIAVVALAVYVVILMVVSPVILMPLANALAARVGPMASVAVRLLIYGVLGILLLATSVWIDYARIHAVTTRTGRPLVSGYRFVGRHLAPVLVVSALTSGCFLAVLAGYAFFEAYTRGAPRAWSAILVGQIFIAARLAARLVTTAAEVQLMQRLERTGD